MSYYYARYVVPFWYIYCIFSKTGATLVLCCNNCLGSEMVSVMSR